MDNGHEPATKQDLAALGQDLRQEVAAVRQEVAAVRQEVAAVRQEVVDVRQDVAILRSEISHQFDDLKEAFRDVQTEMLKAFYSFTESNRQRVTQLEGNQGALITRIGVLEDRMLDLERKVNFPQHPPQ